MSNPPLEFHAKVSRFEEARAALEAHRAQHEKVMATYDLLVSAYNERLQDVKGFYREHHDAIGRKHSGFTAITKTRVDAELLAQLMGPRVDPMIKMTYAIVRKDYDDAVKHGLIPQDIVEKVETTTVEIRGPKEA